jgi:hypothetical protein
MNAILAVGWWVKNLDRGMKYSGWTCWYEKGNRKRRIWEEEDMRREEWDKGVAKGPKVMVRFFLPPKDRGSGPCPHVERYEIHEDQDGQIQSTSISEILTWELAHQLMSLS